MVNSGPVRATSSLQTISSSNSNVSPMQVSFTTVKCACVEHAGQQCSTTIHIRTTVQLAQHPLLVLEANPLPVTALLLLTAGLFLHLQVRVVYFKMSGIENETEGFFFYYSVSYTQYKVGGIRPCCWVHRPFYGRVVFLGIHMSSSWEVPDILQV